jgi:two-component system response regulator DesR
MIPCNGASGWSARGRVYQSASSTHWPQPYCEEAGAAFRLRENLLTPREREVLSASLGGASVSVIAAQLALSEGTVRNHLSVASLKLGALYRTEAARLAEQRGWL